MTGGAKDKSAKDESVRRPSRYAKGMSVRGAQSSHLVSPLPSPKVPLDMDPQAATPAIAKREIDNWLLGIDNPQP